MGGADHCALLLRPFKSVEPESGPVMLGLAAGIHLVLETEQAQVPGLMRAEARHLDVVSKQVRVFGDLVDLADEELFLVIEAGTPGQRPLSKPTQ